MESTSSTHLKLCYFILKTTVCILILSSTPLISSAQKNMKIKSSPTLTDLPTDILCKISEFLKSKNVLMLRLTCKNLNNRFSHSNSTEPIIPFPILRITDRTVESRIRFNLFKKFLLQLQKRNPPLIPLKFNFSKTSITDQKLKTIFCTAPKITELNLSYCLSLNNPDWGKLNFTKTPLGNQVTFLDLFNCTPALLKNFPWTLFRNLKTLNLGLTTVNDPLLNEIIKKCPNITALGLRACLELTFEKTPWEMLKKLKQVNLAGNNLADTSLKTLPLQCPNLKKLNINGCNEITLQNFIWNCTNLKNLKAQATSISSLGFETFIKSCRNLEKINIDACKEIEFESDPKKGPANLKKINIGHTPLTDNQLEKILNNNPRLNIFHLFGCSLLKFENKLSWSKVPLLIDLNIGATKINDQNLEEILSQCKNLTKLKLNSCGALAFKKININPIKLKTLFLDDTKIFDETLNNILKITPLLENLSLCICGSLKFKSIQWNLAKRIKKINLWATNITDTGLAELLANLPLLKDLTLHNCANLNFKKLPWNKAQNLKSLNLNQTSITEDILRDVLRNCPNIITNAVFYCNELSQSSKLREEYPYVKFLYW